MELGAEEAQPVRCVTGYVTGSQRVGRPVSSRLG